MTTRSKRRLDLGYQGWAIIVNLMTVSKQDPLSKIKPKTSKGKRFLESRESKVVENVKGAIFMRGTKTSIRIKETLADLYSLKKPDACFLQKRNSVHPFEGGESEATLEFLSQRNDAGIMVMATHSKKRPDNLVLIRTFDNHILDMIELSVANFESISSIKGPTCGIGMKPAFVFNGELFEQNEKHQIFRSMFLDLFRGKVVEEINLPGLESVISITATESHIFFRVYRILLKKSGTRIPLISLQSMGPSIDFVIGRTRMAVPDLMRQALRKPKEIKPKKEKNISTTSLGETMGRVHVGRQKLDEIQTRKMKALKKPRTEGPKEGEQQQQQQQVSE